MITKEEAASFRWATGRKCPCSSKGCCEAPNTVSPGCLEHGPDCDELCDDNWVTYCLTCKTKCGCEV